MTVQYINVALGSKATDGSYPTTHKGNATSQSSSFSIAYDDAVVTNMNQLRAACAQALLQAEARGLAKG